MGSRSIPATLVSCACILTGLLACAFVGEAAEGAGIPSVHVAPGAIRDLEAVNAKRLSVRLLNRGDCSVGIVARDEARNVTMRLLLRPGEACDHLTPSARIMTATLIARSEGTRGAIVDVLPIEAAVPTVAPQGATVFRCDDVGHTIYRSDDGIAAPEVTYRIANDRESDCVLQVTLLFPDGATPRIETIDAGRSRDVTGAFREIVVTGRGDDEDEFTLTYSRME